MVYNLRISADFRVHRSTSTGRHTMPRPEGTPASRITGPGIKSLEDFAAATIREGIRDFGSAASDLPQFLAGPTPGSAAALPLYGFTRAACRTWARGGGPQNLPGFDAVWGGICTPYLDDIGESPTPGSLEPPLEGGQCAGVLYRIEFSFNNDQEVRQFIEQDALGPIEGVYADPGPFGRTLTGYIASDGTGTPRKFLQNTRNAPGDGNPQVRILFRNDGQPDNCGNPPSEYQPPIQAPNLPPVGPTPVPFPGIGPINVDIGFGPEGDIIVDFPDIDGTVTVPNPTTPEGGGGGGGGAPTNPGSPGGTGSTGDGGSDEGEAGEGEELTGVLVRVLSAHENANKVDRSPVDVFRGVGYVAMGYPGLLGVDTSAAVVESPQFFHAQQRGLTAWRVRANVGFNLETTPYYRETET